MKKLIQFITILSILGVGIFSISYINITETRNKFEGDPWDMDIRRNIDESIMNSKTEDEEKEYWNEMQEITNRVE